MTPHTEGMRANTLMNLAGYGLPIFVSVVTVPRYLGIVGEARYGVLVIVWIMLGYFGVFDLGLGRATTHEIAQCAPDDDEEAGAVFWTAATLNAGLGAVGGLLLLPIAYSLVQYVFKMPPELKHEVTDALPILAAAVPLVTLTSVCTGALQGREHFMASNAVAVLYGVLFQLVPLGVAHWSGSDLVPLIGSAVSVLLVTTALNFAACVWLVPARRARFDRSRVSRLFKFGAWISVTGILSPLISILDRLAVGIAVGAGGVTRYSVPFNLATRLWIIPISFSRTAFPRMAMLARAEAEVIAQDVTAALFTLLTPIVIVGMLLFQPFLHIWIGSKLGPQASAIGEILLLGTWMDGLAYIPNVFLQAQGRPDLPAKLHLLEMLPFLVVLWIGLKAAGVEGGALAWTIRSIGDSILLFWACKVRWRIDTRVVVGSGLLGAAMALALLFPGATTIRIGGDATILVATIVWTWLSLPPAARAKIHHGSLRTLPHRRRVRENSDPEGLPLASPYPHTEQEIGIQPDP